MDFNTKGSYARQASTEQSTPQVSEDSERVLKRVLLCCG